MILTDASHQLFNRPKDEHYDSFNALIESARTSHDDAVERPSVAEQIRFRAADDTIQLDLDDDFTAVPTHYVLTQIGALCRVPLPVLSRLETPTAVRVLNETLPRDGLRNRLALVDGGHRLRALTSTCYERLWDLEILQEIDRWLLPRGFVPAVPTRNGARNLLGNTKPALFRGDRDSFCFFYSGQRPGDDGLGGLRRGLFVWNSEVGARSFGWSTFYFREVCGNFIVWDVRDVRERRAIHRGEVRDVFGEFRAELISTSLQIEQETLDTFHRAAAQPFVGDGSPTQSNRELAEERLQKQFSLTSRHAAAVVESSLLPENSGRLSVWDIVNGVTSVAKEEEYAGDLVGTARLGATILQAV